MARNRSSFDYFKSDHAKTIQCLILFLNKKLAMNSVFFFIFSFIKYFFIISTRLIETSTSFTRSTSKRSP